ncbi:MAG: universal stress protein [Halococcoides sp.]
MTTEPSSANADLLDHVLVPVADADDARATARALDPYDPGQVTAIHVVEKGEGVPDKTPVEQSDTIAEDAYAAVREVFPDADDHTVYRRDVVDAIDEAATDIDASAILFCPRGGNRLIQFLSGDTTLGLVSEVSHPVITLPRAADS